MRGQDVEAAIAVARREFVDVVNVDETPGVDFGFRQCHRALRGSDNVCRRAQSRTLQARLGDIVASDYCSRQALQHHAMIGCLWCEMNLLGESQVRSRAERSARLSEAALHVVSERRCPLMLIRCYNIPQACGDALFNNKMVPIFLGVQKQQKNVDAFQNKSKKQNDQQIQSDTRTMATCLRAYTLSQHVGATLWFPTFCLHILSHPSSACMHQNASLRVYAPDCKPP